MPEVLSQLKVPPQGAAGGILLGGDAPLIRDATVGGLQSDGLIRSGMAGNTGTGLGGANPGVSLDNRGFIVMNRAGAGQGAMLAALPGDIQPRLSFTTDGTIRLGDGASTPDVVLSWFRAKTLALAEDTFLRLNVGTGLAALSRVMAGLDLTGVAMNASSKYTAAIKFLSEDTELTTENPKLLAAIAGRATQTYSADVGGGMAIDIATSVNDPGTTNVPVVNASFVGKALILRPDAPTFTAPTGRLHIGDSTATTPADGIVFYDANLYRSAVDTLKTDDNFEALTVKSGGVLVVKTDDIRLAPSSASLPGSPVDGQEVYYQAATGVLWHLRYRLSTTKWEVLGGAPLFATPQSAGSTQTTAAVSTFAAMSNMGTLTVPLTGTYRWQATGSVQAQAAGSTECRVQGFEAATGRSRVASFVSLGQFALTTITLDGTVNLTAASTLALMLATSNSSWSFGNPHLWNMSITPMLIG